jgi:general secretion pathway protein K
MPKLLKRLLENKRIFSFEKSRALLKDTSGSALMLALFTVTLLLVIAMEIVYESNVEYLVSANSVNEVKAYYAAQAGARISLLRIEIYKKIVAAAGSALPDKSMLDLIWNTPFIWPPVAAPDLNAVDKDALKKTVKESLMKSSFMATISSEGAKIDINDLDSPSSVIRKATHVLLVQMFKSKLENDEKFAKNYRSFDFERLVNHIQDFISAGNESVDGGDKRGAYPNHGPNDNIPPDRPMISLSELHMVADMNDELYDIIAPRLTVFGAKGVNVNYASAEVIQSLDPHITAEMAQKVIGRRNDPNLGPFKDMNDFVSFLNELGMPGNPFVEGSGNQEKVKVPLLFDAEINFKIESIGTAGKVQKKITAIVYDFDRVKKRLSDQLKQEATVAGAPVGAVTGDGLPGGPTGAAAGAPNPPAAAATPVPPPGQPAIVSWTEE